MMFDKKPILCLDFDGVLHSYTSGWKGADVIPDPPVEGAMNFICNALDHFEVHVFSSRSNQDGGIEAMRHWLRGHLLAHFKQHEKVTPEQANNAAGEIAAYHIKFPTEKPPALVTIDDRAITFTGEWPDIDGLLAFKPWNKR